MSLALVFVLITIALGADDRSVVAVAIAFACFLGIPFLLLSLIDLGHILRAESGGDFNATIATRLLSHLQAAFGATCMGAGGYVVYDGVARLSQTVEFDTGALFLRALTGIGIFVVGVGYIWSAFVPGRKEPGGGNDT